MYNNFYIHLPTVADPEMEYVQRKLIQTKLIPKTATNYLTHLHSRLQNNILAGARFMIWVHGVTKKKILLQHIYKT